MFAEITTVSSHSPWTPIPKMVGWDQVGNGSVFDDPANQEGGPPGSIIGDPDKLRAVYIKSIQYSLDALISYVAELRRQEPGAGLPRRPPAGAGRDRREREPGRADHDRGQGPGGAGPDLGLGLDAGLRPAPNAPVGRMDTFRNQFLTAFGPADPAH